MGRARLPSTLWVHVSCFQSHVRSLLLSMIVDAITKPRVYSVVQLHVTSFV